MKLLRYLLPMVVALGFTSAAIYANPFQQDRSRFDIDLNNRDFDALKDFINTKRTIDVEEKATNLTISGDVRTEWRHLTEKKKGHSLRGGHAHTEALPGFPRGLPISRNDFDVEFNLRFDYVCERAWAVAHLQFDNSCGVDDNKYPAEPVKPPGGRFDPQGYHGSGTRGDINLKRAYWGYNICCECGSRFDIEIGRRPLYTIFDSHIQYLSRFDGILLKYSSSFDCFGKWYWNTGAFVVDERVNHFAYITELGFLNICDTGIDFKYSFIHWNKNGINRCWEHNPKGFRFNNSQFTLYYNFNPEMLCMPAQVYGAFLVNHSGRYRLPKRVGEDSSSSSEKRKSLDWNDNVGWYVGFKVGNVVKEGDWAFEAQYQYVGARACPDNDVSGIGRGNVQDDSFTGFDNNLPLNRGNTNYKGFKFEGLYALTDNLTIDSILEFSRAAKSSIGGRHRYSKFEIEAIYAF